MVAVAVFLAVGLALLGFVVLPFGIPLLVRNHKYPIKLQRYNVRLSRNSPFTASQVKGTIDRIAFFWPEHFPGEVTPKDFDGLLIEFLPGTDGKRYIVDSYGRKISGDHNRGNRARVVFLVGDSPDDTALRHELLHHVAPPGHDHTQKSFIDLERAARR